jgi:hypothetical protein
MSCPEIRRALAIIKPENRETWEQVYSLCYQAVCTPSLDAPAALDILIDRMIELRQWSGFRSVERARTVAFIYARRRCGMFGPLPKRSTGT